MATALTTERSRNVGSAASSLVRVIQGARVPGLLVSTNSDQGEILITATEDSTEQDRYKLRELTRDGWEGCRVVWRRGKQ